MKSKSESKVTYYKELKRLSPFPKVYFLVSLKVSSYLIFFIDDYFLIFENHKYYNVFVFSQKL